MSNESLPNTGLNSGGYRVEKYGSRFHAVYDPKDELVVVAVYRKGALEVVRRLTNTNLNLEDTHEQEG